MRNPILALCAILMLAAATPLAAQDTKADVLGVSKGQLFSARLTVQSEGLKQDILYLHPQPTEAAVKLGTLECGREYKIRSGHLRFGWPQNAAYVVLEGGKEVRRTEATYEPVTIKLKAGQQLRAEFTRHYEPYDGRMFVVKDVPCCLILPRGYWYQDVAPGQFKGPEPFPNSLFFLVDTEWGFGKKDVLRSWRRSWPKS